MSKVMRASTPTMPSSAKLIPRSSAPTTSRHCGLQYLEGDILALVSVAAGLKSSLLLPLCCVSLRQALASPVMDDQLFGRLYAALAGVENPDDALLHPPPPTSPSRLKDAHRRRRHNAQQDTSSNDSHSGPAPIISSSPMPRPLSQTQSGTKRDHWYSSLSDEASAAAAAAAAAAEVTSARGDHRLVSGYPLAETYGPSTSARPSEGVSGREVSGSLKGDGDLRLIYPSSGETVVSATPRSAAQAAVSRQSERRETFHTSWKARLKRDLATGRRPTETFVFSGQRVGKQDVLMAVVPSSPAVIAVTCTTELSLFYLDGARLPATTRCALSRDEDVTSLGRPSGGGGGGGGRGGGGEHAVHCEGVGRQCAGVVERHERDIRCLSCSPSGEMVATGSLDCTIRVRSVPGCEWVRRLRGHESGVRCLAFCRNRLVSADSLGVLSVWDIYPVARRLQAVRGHTDSVQVLTWTGGGEQLASGALDGSVLVWSVSPLDGTLTRTVAYGGLCHPYGLVAVGRCLAFTSSPKPGMRADASSGLALEDDGVSDLTTSRASHISVVALPGGPAQRVCTGQARTNHLVAGGCVGAVVVSPVEVWSCDGGGSSEDEWELPQLFPGERRGDYAPRLCRIVSTGRIAVAGAAERRVCRGTGREGGGGVRRKDESHGKYPEVTNDTDITDTTDKGPDEPCVDECPKHDKGEGLEDSSGGALCTCAVFVGRTLFLGFDTGGVWAHRVSDGRRLYRLSARGPLVHLVEAGGSLFAYASSGVVSRWTWQDR